MVNLTIADQDAAELTLTVTEEVSLETETVMYLRGDDYTGDYEFTPTEDTQTVPISGKTATQNIVINPIPSNYGLITYNGSVITVS